ncbi:transporter [Flavobacterium cellulosilyticum]|uniref:Transporter n=1 Tax=Flavobacterium cellulosilyticum TaxID=2541731 RepID=A0A4V2YZI4_9FLAO|nr:hypothetical protein [Flavobacterium cellulosilyticum]TDD96947.1 hypothetical protein E0F76_09895 [Flavobacterium cellulosilyticum]
MKKIILLFVLALFATTSSYSQCACCAASGASATSTDYNNGILTLQKKQFVIETYGDYRTIQDGHAHEHDEKLLKSMFISSLGVRYGVTDKITISALVPYVFLHTNDGNNHGIGDLNLMGTFTVFSKNNLNFGLQAGIELPTGIQKNSNFDNSTVVVGSGSYDPIVGVLFSKHWDKMTLVGNALYKYTTKGFQDNYYGSIAIQNLSLSYKIIEGGRLNSIDEKEENKSSNFGWNIFGGYYGEGLDKLKEDLEVDENSGYYLGFANLGTTLSHKKWSFPLTLSVPIINKMNGEQNDAGVRLRFGIIKSF